MGMQGFCVFLILPLLGSSYIVHDPDTAERFPLSGGLRVGMDVKVTVKGFDGNNSKLEFVTPSGEIAFMFEINSHTKTIIRGGQGRTTETWGGWPFGESAEGATLRFTNSQGHLWAYINNEFAPWFSWEVTVEDPITHVWVFSGFQEPEVLVTRPGCKPCSSDECTDLYGRNMCKDANGTTTDAAGCSVKKLSMGLPTECKSAASPNDGSECCMGSAKPLSPAVFESHPNEAKWFELVSDTSRVDQACTAFGFTAEDCANIERNVAYKCSGNVVDGLVSCSAEGYHEGQPVMIPISMLKFVTVRVYNYTMSGQDMKDTEINYDTLFITKSGMDGMQGLYAYVNHERGSGQISDPWVYVIKDRYDFWRDGGFADLGHVPGVNMLASNIPRPIALECMDLRVDENTTWTDKEGRTCDMYANENQTLCNTKGFPTKEFEDLYGEGKNLYDDAVSNYGWGAPKPCCVCGGGSLGGDRYNLPSYMASLHVETKSVQIETK